MCLELYEYKCKYEIGLYQFLNMKEISEVCVLVSPGSVKHKDWTVTTCWLSANYCVKTAWKQCQIHIFL